MSSTDATAQANGHSEEPQEDATPTSSEQSDAPFKEGNAPTVKKEESGSIEVAQPRFLLGNRPIEPSTLKVVYSAGVGNRPIFASEMQVVNTDLLPGHRPIMASSSELLNADMLLGNRPIAANEVDDPLTLMGYLD
jgi:hypothetical protein